ncbi:hypothetical protein ABVK25_004072 [Lepraria finkii]|uniref:Uncharacterized protein n=1 Tax=Lepraria finkii TaxID=1340010 RepID=A0ABR4BDA1_9LECA
MPKLLEPPLRAAKRSGFCQALALAIEPSARTTSIFNTLSHAKLFKSEKNEMPPVELFSSDVLKDSEAWGPEADRQSAKSKACATTTDCYKILRLKDIVDITPPKSPSYVPFETIPVPLGAATSFDATSIALRPLKSIVVPLAARGQNGEYPPPRIATNAPLRFGSSHNTSLIIIE